MKVNKELIINRYHELKRLGETEGLLDERLKIKLFINKKPQHLLFYICIDEDKIYIGA